MKSQKKSTYLNSATSEMFCFFVPSKLIHGIRLREKDTHFLTFGHQSPIIYKNYFKNVDTLQP